MEAEGIPVGCVLPLRWPPPGVRTDEGFWQTGMFWSSSKQVWTGQLWWPPDVTSREMGISQAERVSQVPCLGSERSVLYHVTYPTMHVMSPPHHCEQTHACENIEITLMTTYLRRIHKPPWSSKFESPFCIWKYNMKTMKYPFVWY